MSDDKLEDKLSFLTPTRPWLYYPPGGSSPGMGGNGRGKSASPAGSRSPAQSFYPT